MTGILEQFKWESLKKRRMNNRLIVLFQGLKDKIRIATDGLIPKTRLAWLGVNSHSMAFQLPSVCIEAYKCISFPRLSGTGTTSLTLMFSSPAMPDDCVSKFVSHLGSMDYI